MPLLERIMGIEQPKLPVHDFFAANHERIEGRLTRADVISLFAMDAATVLEYDRLVASAPTGTSALATAQKALFIEKIHAVFILAEGGYAGYNTSAAIRLKLGI